MTVALRIRGVTKIQIIGGTRGDGAAKVGRVAVKGGSRDAHLGVTAKVDGPAAVVNAGRSVASELAVGHLKAKIDGHRTTKVTLIFRERASHNLDGVGHVENGRNGAARRARRIACEFGIVDLKLTVAVEKGTAVLGRSILREKRVPDDHGRAILIEDRAAAVRRVFFKAAVLNENRAVVTDIDGTPLAGSVCGLVLHKDVILRG